MKVVTGVVAFNNLLSSLLRCGMRLNEWSAQ